MIPATKADALREGGASRKTAQEYLTDMTAAPSLDLFFTRQENSDAEISRLVAIFRDERALFISKGETTRRDKDET